MRTPVPILLRNTIAGLATTLASEIHSPYAQAELRYAFALLDTIAAEWDTAAETLVRENDAVQAFLQEAAAAARAPEAPAELAALAGRLEAGATLPPATDLRLSTLAARNDALWEAATPLIELLGAASDAPWAQPLIGKGRPLLRGFVAARTYPPSS
jgi:hypothetical protein